MKELSEHLHLVGIDDLRTRMPIREALHGCLACSSRTTSVFCDLAADRLKELDRMRRRAAYPAGAVVFMEGEEARGVYCVCSGRLKLSTASPEGRAAILSVVTGGDYVGLRSMLSGRPHDVTAETLERAELCFIRKADFLAFLNRNADISLRVAEKLSTELFEAYQQIRGAMLKQSSERLAELLLTLCQTHGEPVAEGIRLDANLRQDELAELIGVSRRNLARMLAKLRNLGIVECRRRCIIIRDDDALRNQLSA